MERIFCWPSANENKRGKNISTKKIRLCRRVCQQLGYTYTNNNAILWGISGNTLAQRGWRGYGRASIFFDSSRFFLTAVYILFIAMNALRLRSEFSNRLFAVLGILNPNLMIPFIIDRLVIEGCGNECQCTAHRRRVDTPLIPIIYFLRVEGSKVLLFCFFEMGDIEH